MSTPNVIRIGLCGFGTGDAAARTDTGVFRVSARDPHLRIKREDERGDEQKEKKVGSEHGRMDWVENARNVARAFPPSRRSDRFAPEFTTLCGP